MPSSHLILCHSLLLLPSVSSSIRIFSNESAFCIRWPKYWSFSLNISPSSEYSGLISFRIEWFDLLTYKTLSRVFSNTAVQFSSVQFIRSVVSDSLRPHEWQHARPPCPSSSPRVHSDSRPSSQWCHPAISSSVIPFSSCPQSLPASEFFPMSQFFAWGAHPYMTTVKTIALTRWTFVGKVMSLLSRSLQRRRGSVVAYCRVGGTECSSTCMGSFEGGHHYLHYLHHSLAPGK